jgi:hypothetical protein
MTTLGSADGARVAPAPRTRAPSGPAAWLDRWRPRWTRSDAYRRLESELDVTWLRYVELVGAIEKPGAWAEAMRGTLEAAAGHLRHDVQTGWRYLHHARGLELHGLAERSATLLWARLESLRSEVDVKATGYRRQCAMDLLDGAKTLRGESAAELAAGAQLGQEASRLLHETYDNAHYKEGVLREKAYGLIALLAVPLFAWVIVASLGPFRVADGGLVTFVFTATMDQFAAPHGFTFFTAIVFGMVGATLSGLRGVSAALQARSTTRIPDLLYGKLLVFIQVGTGIAAGLLVYLLQFTTVVNVQEDVTFALFAFLCVVAGFSERFLVSRIEQVSPPPPAPTR